MTASNDWITQVMATKDQKYFKELGARLAAARKRAGMTQLELAEALGVPQQTLAHYETGRSRVPITLLLGMAELLNFSLDEMLMSRAPARGKRGPASKIELQLEAVARLPKSKQRVVAAMIEGVLAQRRSG